MTLDDSIVDQMRAWDAPADQIARVQSIAQQAAPEQKAFGIWHDNVRTLDCFHGLRTQWTYVSVPVGMGAVSQRVGLNYAAVQSFLDLTQPRRFHRSLMQDLHLMEIAVLQADAELRQEREESR